MSKTLDHIRSRLTAWPMHPFLIALYAPLSLLAYNISEVQVDDTWRSMLVSLGLAAILLGIGRLLFRDLQRAGLFASLLLILFFSYGHFYEWGRNLSQMAFEVFRHRYLLPVLLVATVLIGLGVRRSKLDLEPMTGAGNLITFALILFLGLQIALSEDRPIPAETVETEAEQECPTVEREPGNRPDIFYIILDGYARHDILEDRFGYDNSWFLDELRGMGFYVAESSQSNYSATRLSLSSSLNYSYLIGDYAEEPPGTPIGDVSVWVNKTTRTLRCLGYQIVAFDTGYYWTSWDEADYLLSPTHWSEGTLATRGLAPFEAFLVQNSILRVFLDFRPGLLNLLGIDLSASHAEHRDRVVFALNQLESGLASLPSPKFVFGHIVSPHPPYLFDSDGSFVESNAAFTLADNPGGGETRTVEEGYAPQLHFLNTRMVEILPRIIEYTGGEAVIIVQGDHGVDGPRYDRMSILNAYYFPTDSQPELYPTISPVNTFRVVLNTYFDADLELLPDRSYYSTYNDLYDFRYLSNPDIP